MSEFERELANLINKHSVENSSDTADWILARYLMNCLSAFSIAIQSSDEQSSEDFTLEEDQLG